MSWVVYILFSAVALAVYDLLKKSGVRNNAVLPVLTVATLAGALAYAVAFGIFSDFSRLLQVTPRLLALSSVKVVIVGMSWIFTYMALRTLPITIATPIRASAPVFVTLIAFFLYAERPSFGQWTGMSLVLVGFFAFSWAGRAEGIDFLRNRAVYCAMAGMLCSSASSLYDKYVFQVVSAPVEVVQFFFQVGLFLFYSLILAGSVCWQRGKPVRTRFVFRPSVPFIGITLALADWLYFRGLAMPETLISVASLMRRFSVVITFFLGAVLFREHNLRRKSFALMLILLGMTLLSALAWK